MKIKLKAEAGPVVIVAEAGEYYAEFHRELEPFEVDETAWLILERTGLFESAESV